MVETRAKDRIALNVDEVAAELHLHPQTVQRLAKRGSLPGRKVGRAWYFAPEAIRDFITTVVL
jgi:excisionase family DNA binding protein